MKIEKLELTYADTPPLKNEIIILDVKIPLNQKIIKSWVAGMDKIERESFYSILAEFMIKGRK